VRNLSTAEIYRADEVFCTGTMGELVGVTSVDGRPIGKSEVGPMTKRLSRLFAQATEKQGYRIV
jgi:branched-chain amino acid aminotransferase